MFTDTCSLEGEVVGAAWVDRAVLNSERSGPGSPVNPGGAGGAISHIDAIAQERGAFGPENTSTNEFTLPVPSD